MNLTKIRLPVLIAWYYLKRNRKLILGVAFLIIILIVIQSRFHFFSSPNAVRIGLVGTYQEHDLPKEVTELVSVGLVKIDQDGRVKPNLAGEWEVNSDATEFKFKLKENLRWFDNTLIKASDLEFNIPNTEISFPDERTIQFKLKEPYSPLPSLLVKSVFKKGSTLLGIGPYRITKIEKSRIFITKITLQANDPKLPVVYVRFYPNESVAVAGFNLGEVQVLLGLSNPKLLTTNFLIGTKQKTDYSKIVTILFQTQDPLLNNRSLRQALAYQAPEIKGEKVANNPYPPNSWVYDSDSKKYLSSPKEAKAALERAKSNLPNDKIRSELILTVTPNLEDVGKMVVAAWKDLGFDAKLRIESGIPQNFQALLITQSIPADPDQYFLWHTTQTKTNLAEYDSKRVDKDLEDGRKLITEDERRAKYFDFQKTLLEDTPAVFLYFPKYNVVYLKKIESFLDQVWGVDRPYLE